MDIEDIRKNYRNFDDSKIQELAKQDASKLRPDVVLILMEEIRRRNLSENLISGIDAQLKILSPEELLDYCTLIQKQPCPICNGKTQKLNAIILKEVMSVILLSNVTSHLKIGCPQCLKESKSKINLKTALLGLWSTKGIFYTIKALVQNKRMEKYIRNYEPNEILKSYILENIGVIEPNKNNPIALNNMLKRANRVDQIQIPN
jgi:hypothetical protein